ncbi:MAG: YciI family protein [Actinomycetota bacterium]|nr:YciI family protein [Actinomycetota bacterium]
MQYMLSVHNIEGENPYASDEEMQAAFAAVEKFNADLQEKGSWVFGCGLMPASTATVIDGRGDEPVITDGPFAEAREQLGGYWVIEAADLDAALDWARQASVACANPVEVRPLQPED